MSYEYTERHARLLAELEECLTFALSNHVSGMGFDRHDTSDWSSYYNYADVFGGQPDHRLEYRACDTCPFISMGNIVVVPGYCLRRTIGGSRVIPCLLHFYATSDDFVIRRFGSTGDSLDFSTPPLAAACIMISSEISDRISDHIQATELCNDHSN